MDQANGAENRTPPKVSIVTVVFNGAKTLERTIKSVLDQTYPNIEYIIIDGGSTDGTQDIIRKYEDRLASWVSEPDGGIYDAMNKGIAKSTGFLIGLVNSDDWLEPGAVADVVSHIPEKERLFIIHGDTNQWRNGRLYRTYHSEREIRPHSTFIRVSHPTCFVPAEVYREIGVYSLEYKIVADADFLLRANDYPMPFIHTGTVISNMSGGGVSQKHFFRAQLEGIRLRRKLGVPAWKLYLNAIKQDIVILFLSPLKRLLTGK